MRTVMWLAPVDGWRASFTSMNSVATGFCGMCPASLIRRWRHLYSDEFEMPVSTRKSAMVSPLDFWASSTAAYHDGNCSRSDGRGGMRTRFMPPTWRRQAANPSGARGGVGRLRLNGWKWQAESDPQHDQDQ